MSKAQAPGFKLPDVTPPKVARPNPDPWAAKQSNMQTKTPKTTNRDKYENKPMPPTPEASPSPTEQQLTARKTRGYIQPAIPLTPNVKNRAATDPVMPKPLFTSKTATVNQLRQKYSQSKNKRKSNEENVTHQPASPPLVIAHKASQILGVYPVKEIHQVTPPVSAPPSTHTPDPFRTSTECVGGRQTSPSRQVHSTPVPTRRYLQENHLPAFVDARASQESKEVPDMLDEDKKQPPKDEPSEGSLNPARLGVYGRKGEVEFVGQSGMQRVPSFAGIIEQPDSPKEVEATTAPYCGKSDWDQNSLRPQCSGEVLHSMVYTSGEYAGVWENDPNVVSVRCCM